MTGPTKYASTSVVGDSEGEGFSDGYGEKFALNEAIDFDEEDELEIVGAPGSKPWSAGHGARRGVITPSKPRPVLRRSMGRSTVVSVTVGSPISGRSTAIDPDDPFL